MHARVTTARVRPGSLATAATTVQEALLPTARDQPGFLGFVVLTNRAADRLMLVTLWATEAAMEGGETEGYYQAQLAKFGDVLRGQPTRETFAVRGWELTAACAVPTLDPVGGRG